MRAALLSLALLAAGPALAQGDKPDGSTPPAAISATTLLGRWGDNGDCSKYVVFRGDGTFTTPDGAGTWQLAGDRLTLSGPGGSSMLIVRPEGRDRLRIQNPDGSVGYSQRC